MSDPSKYSAVRALGVELRVLGLGFQGLGLTANVGGGGGYISNHSFNSYDGPFGKMQQRDTS